MTLRESRPLLAVGGALCVALGMLAVAVMLKASRPMPLAGQPLPVVSAEAHPHRADASVSAPPAAGVVAALPWNAPPLPISDMNSVQIEALFRDVAIRDRATTWTARALVSAEPAVRDRLLEQFTALSDHSVTMGLLDRDPERFKEHLAVLSGEVLEIHENAGANRETFMRVWVDRRNASAVLAVFATATTVPDDVVTGTRVRVYGVILRPYTYESQAHYNITIPRMDTIAVVRTGGR